MLDLEGILDIGSPTTSIITFKRWRKLRLREVTSLFLIIFLINIRASKRIHIYRHSSVLLSFYFPSKLNSSAWYLSQSGPTLFPWASTSSFTMEESWTRWPLNYLLNLSYWTSIYIYNEFPHYSSIWCICSS